ncbi:hypothetical protein ASU4_04575, partial [Actinobacillus suis]
LDYWTTNFSLYNREGGRYENLIQWFYDCHYKAFSIKGTPEGIPFPRGWGRAVFGRFYDF